MDPAILDRRFAHHPPRRPGIADLHEQTRARCRALARWLNEVLPASPETDLALSAVDLACMHSNAAIARHLNYRDDAMPDGAVDLEALAERLARRFDETYVQLSPRFGIVPDPKQAADDRELLLAVFEQLIAEGIEA